MPTHKASRKQLFRAALSLSGLSAAQWAEREGITPEHLSYVLNDRRESRTLTEKIDQFANETLNKHKTALAS